MKKLDEGQRIMAGIILGMGTVIIATQILLFFANRQKPSMATMSAPAAPAPAPAAVPGQV
jgi:hypothetical protein